MDTKPTTVSGSAGKPASEEPRNVAVECLENRTKIGKAIVAAGRVDFPLTASEAKALEALGKVKIIGVWEA